MTSIREPFQFPSLSREFCVLGGSGCLRKKNINTLVYDRYFKKLAIANSLKFIIHNLSFTSTFFEYIKLRDV